MKPAEYQRFTEQLTRNLAAEAQVLGLVACGSMAQTHHQPDEWSDHDLWVVVEPGSAEGFRQDVSWLPNADEIVLVYRETAHAVKVVYRQGHLIEAAIFEPADLDTIAANAYRVLLDRADIAAVMSRIQARTAQQAQDSQHDDSHHFGQMLTTLMVGAGRYARGEKFSGHMFIKVYALSNLLPLLVKYGETEKRDILDNLDVTRRFEFAFPEWGVALNAILLLEPPEAARQMLDFADRVLRDRLDTYPAEGVAIIRQYLKQIG